MDGKQIVFAICAENLLIVIWRINRGGGSHLHQYACILEEVIASRIGGDDF